MKQLLIFLSIIVAVSVLTAGLMAFNRPKGSNGQEPKIIELKLPVNDVDLILSGLAKLPYETSAQLINKIVAQAQPQMQPVKADTAKPKKN